MTPADILPRRPVAVPFMYGRRRLRGPCWVPACASSAGIYRTVIASVGPDGIPREAACYLHRQLVTGSAAVTVTASWIGDPKSETTP